jgi:hypothetical protein
VSRLVAEGDRHARLAENAEALSAYIEALDLVPEPRGDHLATEQIFHGLTRVLQSRGDLGDGIELLLATRPGVGSILVRMAADGAGVTPSSSPPARATARPAPSPGRSPRG